MKNLVVTLIFIFQSAFAGLPEKSLISANYEVKVAESVHKKLSTVKKFKDILPEIEMPKPEDKEFLKNMNDKIGEENFPKMSVQGNVLTFEIEKRKIKFEFVSSLQRVYKLNGYLFQINPKKSMAENYKYIERIIQSRVKTVSGFWQEIVLGASSEALGPLLIIASGVILVAGYLKLKAPVDAKSMTLEENVKDKFKNKKVQSILFSCDPYKIRVKTSDGYSEISSFSEDMKIMTMLRKQCLIPDDITVLNERNKEQVIDPNSAPTNQPSDGAR